jgi:lipoate---protein ligase
MIEVADYCLPDSKLLESDNDRFLIWSSDKLYIVLGASNYPEESLITQNVRHDNIPVLKRPSGGQTVLLSPDNLVLSIVFTGKNALPSGKLFYKINSILISALEEAGLTNLSISGISDISISGKKLSGSAIYKNKEKLLYHVVINTGEPSSTFERYLKHPVREPQYRNGRNHKDFITSLKDNGYNGGTDELGQILMRRLNQNLNLLFA